MHCETIIDKINTVNEEVKETSFEAKTNVLSEAEINKFLDGINSVRGILIEKTNKLNSIIEKVESISWANDVDEECLRTLNELIASSRDLHSIFVKEYVRFLNPLKIRGICNTEIKSYKLAIDSFKEVYSDIESVFFFLPKDSEFIELTERLKSI
jgi:hypothetical protein